MSSVLVHEGLHLEDRTAPNVSFDFPTSSKLYSLTFSSFVIVRMDSISVLLVNKEKNELEKEEKNDLEKEEKTS